MEYKKRLKLILAAGLFLGLVYFFPVTAMAGHTHNIPTDYNFVAGSENYELYLYEETMSVILKNKITGVTISSSLSEEDDDGKNNQTWMAYMQSGLVMTAIQGTNDTYQVDLVSTPNTITYTYNTDGFSAQIYFREWQFGLTVHVALEGDDFVVWVPDESIIEENDNNFIGTVSLFPFMGYTYLDSREGYMFIPDGNGALIYLDNKRGRYSSGFSQMIYGQDIGFSESSAESFLWDFYRMVDRPEAVVMPVFGMAHTDEGSGYVAIVEEGEKRASIEVHPNGVMVNYNRCFAKFTVRRIYIQPLNNSNKGTMPMVEASRSHSDLKVRYTLLSGDNADYSGMAVAYRNYLLKNDLLAVKDNAYRTRVDFLGTDREQFLTGTRAVTMTTTDNIREIYDYFRDAGIESLTSIYVGWQKGGLYRLPINSYKADRAIGGNSELTKLIADSAKDDYQIYLFNDALNSNEKTNKGAAFNVVKGINKRRLRLNTWQQVYRYFNYLLPEKSGQTLDRFAKSYRKSGNTNLALTEITNNLYSYSNAGNFYSRFDTADSYTATIRQLSGELNIVMDTPFAYLWKYTDAYMGMPLSSSHYMYEDESVPFMSIVLKGIIPMYSDYVNFEANKHEFKLKMVETGAYPSFYITYKDSAELIYTNSAHLYSTLFDTYQETIVEYDQLFRAVAEKTAGAFIIKHERLTDSVNVTTYDNGTRVYVNYSEGDVTVEGVFIGGLDYTVVEE